MKPYVNAPQKHSSGEVLGGVEKASLRLQVFLSRSGVCSRREALRFIEDGRVKVNGVVVREASTPICAFKDAVWFDGQRIAGSEYQYVLLHKPKGYVTTLDDPHARRTIMDLLPQELRTLRPAGRLDKDTEGLLLLTNDGDVIYRLTHPKFDVDKVYEVWAKGHVRPEEKGKIEKGILLEGERTAPAKVTQMIFVEGTTKFFLTIHEGRKRQIRLMLASVGHPVLYLKRIQQGPLQLGNLKKGFWRKLTPQEIVQLRKGLS